MEAQKAAEAEAARIEADRIARAKKRGGGLLRRSLTKVSPTSRTSLPTNSLLSIDLGVDSPRRRESGISPAVRGLAVSPAARGGPEDRQTPKVADGGANGRYTGEELELSEKDEKDEDSNSFCSNKSDSHDELLVEGNAAANGGETTKEAKPNFVLRLESTVSNEAITPLRTQNYVSQRNSSTMMVDSEAANADGAQKESQYGS